MHGIFYDRCRTGRQRDGNRLAESGAYVSLGQPVHSSYRQLVRARIFITARPRQRRYPRVFGPADPFFFFFALALSESIPVPATKTSRPPLDIARTQRYNRISFQIRGFCLNYTCANFNRKSASAVLAVFFKYMYIYIYVFFFFYLFVRTRSRYTATSTDGIVPVEFFDGGTAAISQSDLLKLDDV